MFLRPSHRSGLSALRAAICTALVVAAAALASGHATPARADEALPQVALFGSAEQAEPNLAPFPKWTGVLERYAHERALEQQPCAGGGCALQRWKAFLGGLRGQGRMRQLEAVNQYVNQTPYQSDPARYGMVDYWATPAEFFGRTGDCEDYAIAKYLSLRQLGWPASHLRILVLNNEVRRELHAVLVAYHGGTAYVLDNLNGAVIEQSAIRHYRPIFSINESAWYVHRNWNPAGAGLVAAHPPAVPGQAGQTVEAAPATRPVVVAESPPPAGLAGRQDRPGDAAAVLSGEQYRAH